MATTPNGAIQLRDKTVEIRDSVLAVQEASLELLNLANGIIAKLEDRVSDGEAPREDKIAGIQAALSGSKTNLAALVSVIEVPTSDSLVSLASEE